MRLYLLHFSLVNRPGDLDLWPFDLWMGSQVTRVRGFHPANIQL